MSDTVLAGFQRLTYRGDTDFSQTNHLDRWDADAVRFVFGYDARANVMPRRHCRPRRGGGWSAARHRRSPPSRAHRPNVKEATIPVQVVRTSRRLVFRLLAWNPWQAVFLRSVDQWRKPLPS